jgi:hypothetical protein
MTELALPHVQIRTPNAENQKPKPENQNPQTNPTTRCVMALTPEKKAYLLSLAGIRSPLSPKRPVLVADGGRVVRDVDVIVSSADRNCCDRPDGVVMVRRKDWR